MKSRMTVRLAQAKDGQQIGQLIYDTVHLINRQDYSQQQVEAWCPDPTIFSTYEKSYAYVVELDELIIGFGNLTETGYLNRFYVHHRFQRQGIGQLLLQTIENKAREEKLKEITTEASMTAKPFFLAHGWVVQEEQTIILRKMSFINFKMFKKLV